MQKPKCHLLERNWECRGCKKPKAKSHQKPHKPTKSRKAKKPRSQKRKQVKTITEVNTCLCQPYRAHNKTGSRLQNSRHACAQWNETSILACIRIVYGSETPWAHRKTEQARKSIFSFKATSSFRSYWAHNKAGSILSILLSMGASIIYYSVVFPKVGAAAKLAWTSLFRLEKASCLPRILLHPKSSRLQKCVSNISLLSNHTPHGHTTKQKHIA